MASPQERAFTLVTDFTRQLITLCAAILALEVSFVASSAITLSEATRTLFGLSWLLLLLSIASGLVLFMKLIGEEATQQDQKAPPADPYSHWIKRLASAQILLFALAIALSAVAGWQAL